MSIAYANLSRQAEHYMLDYHMDPAEAEANKYFGRGRLRYYNQIRLLPPAPIGSTHYGEVNAWNRLRATIGGWQKAKAANDLPEAMHIEKTALPLIEGCKTMLQQFHQPFRNQLLEALQDCVNSGSTPHLEPK